MSSQKGNVSRSRSQKYKNQHSFKNDMHDTSGKTKMINSLNPGEGLCDRCKGIIEWKIKYKKYKPLTKPATCVRCKEKTVKRAYHIVCQPCAQQAGVCAKCNTKQEVEQPGMNDTDKQKQDAELQFHIKQLTERQRRAYYRHLEKGGVMDHSEQLAMAKGCGGKDSWSSDDDLSDEDEEEEQDAHVLFD